MGNPQRSELIVKFAQNVDITPLLGSHHWPRFHRRPGAKQVISYIFEYKYITNGDPETRALPLFVEVSLLTVADNR